MLISSCFFKGLDSSLKVYRKTDSTQSYQNGVVTPVVIHCFIWTISIRWYLALTIAFPQLVSYVAENCVVTGRIFVYKLLVLVLSLKTGNYKSMLLKRHLVWLGKSMNVALLAPKNVGWPEIVCSLNFSNCYWRVLCCANFIPIINDNKEVQVVSDQTKLISG